MADNNSPGLKILFFSSTEFAIPSLDRIIESCHTLTAIVTIPDKQKGRGRKVEEGILKKYASERNILCLTPEDLKDENFLNRLAEIKPDIGIVVDFKILPKEVFTLPKFATIGIHPSLLPSYRGAAPINWTIINGEKETGITVFLLSEKVDAGDMLLSKKIEIKENETAGELRERLSFESADIVLECIEKIRKNEISPLKQDKNLLSSAPKIKPHHLIIDWSKSAEDIHNLIRGLSPSPAAYTTFRNTRLKIFKSRIIDREKTCGSAGSVHCANKNDGFIINTGKGLLSIEELMKEGKKRMEVKTFLIGTEINTGEILS